MSCVLVTFSLNKFTFSLLFSRKRTNLCVIFTALFISELLKMGVRSASLAWFQALWSETQSSGKLITRKVQANVRELRGWKVSFWGGIKWAECVGIQAADGSTASLDGQQKDWGCPHGKLSHGRGRWMWITLFWPQSCGRCKETEKQLTQNMQCYLYHGLPTEVIVTRFIPSQRIPRTENRWDSTGYSFHSDGYLWVQDISEKVGLRKCWGS